MRGMEKIRKGNNLLIMLFYLFFWKRKSIEFVYYFFGTLSGIFCFFTCYDGAPLRSPVLEKGVMLGVLLYTAIMVLGVVN
jgi:hypothetical protein